MQATLARYMKFGFLSDPCAATASGFVTLAKEMTGIL